MEATVDVKPELEVVVVRGCLVEVYPLVLNLTPYCKI